MRRHLSIWQCAWAALVVAGHVALVPALKSNPRWVELVLLVAYGLLVVVFMRDEGLRPRPARLEAVWRILLAAVETAASVGWIAFAVIIEVAPGIVITVARAAVAQRAYPDTAQDPAPDAAADPSTGNGAASAPPEIDGPTPDDDPSR
jgi:hypothetical protein